MIKELIFRKIISILDQRIVRTRRAIELAKESRDNETKSSVGDKYETGRTLMQLEVEKNRILLIKTEKLKAELSGIDLHKQVEKVDYGSLVITSQNNYFISAAIGKIELDNKDYFCISLASPMGNLLYGRKVGDKIVFRGKEFTITELA